MGAVEKRCAAPGTDRGGKDLTAARVARLLTGVRPWRDGHLGAPLFGLASQQLPTEAGPDHMAQQLVLAPRAGKQPSPCSRGS
jgi:hypothetical protein